MVRLRPLVWRYRFVLAAACLGWALILVLGELRPPPDPTTSAVVAAEALPAGTVLTAADVETRQVRDPPPQTVSVADAVGSTLAVGVSAGLPLVPSLLVGPGLVSAAPPGTVVTPIRLADPALARMVRVGDRLDLYLAPVDTGGQLLEAELITAGALVLSRVDEAEAQVGLFDQGTAADPSSGVLVMAISAADAGRVSGASALASFRAVLVEAP